MVSPVKRYVSLNIIAAVAIFGLFAVMIFSSKGDGWEEDAYHSEGPLTAPAERPLEELSDTTLLLSGEILPHKGMFQAIMEMGISQPLALKMVNILRFEVELTRIQVGEKLSAKVTDDTSKILEFLYQPNSVTFHRLVRDQGDSLVYQLTELETKTKYRIVEGTLEQGSSLNDILLQQGVPQDLTQMVNGILLCKISFRTDARAGDNFRVMLKENFYGTERISGDVLYAAYQGRRTGAFEAFRYWESDPKSSYNAHYLRDGEALVFSGLRYPIDRLHISSSYGMRRHPVTGQRVMHSGVDYAASTGTKVYSVAAGKVVVSNYDPLSGNKVAIKHRDNSISYYLHLSSRAVKNGQRVRTRQVIGRVGATGRVTGPHLHFGFKNSKGKWMNPLKKRMIATPKLEGEKLASLKAQIEEIETHMLEVENRQEIRVAMNMLGFGEKGMPLDSVNIHKTYPKNTKTGVGG